jgi:leucyl/phenylalanyl-tRNA---protein transferase
MGKTLDLNLLLHAYGEGYFPMPETGTEEIHWYFPDPRAVIPLNAFRASRSLIRSIRKQKFEFSRDSAFSDVMQGCAAREETWINVEFMRAYGELFRQGFAHSVEVWQEKTLVGGVYGVSLGGAFFAESKFHQVTDASKAALYHLVHHLRERHFQLLEVQFMTPHLATLGAIEIPGEKYKTALRRAIQVATSF